MTEPGPEAQTPRRLSAADPIGVERAVTVLLEGGLVALPTETVYGLACRLDAAALERLLDAKQRPPTKGITLAVDGVEQVTAIAVLPEAARRLAARFWPGPLTLVLPVRDDVRLPDLVTGGGDAVGVRLPDHPAPRALARAVGAYPLTSANLSGRADPRTADDVVADLGTSVQLVLDDGPVRGGVPSTVVRVGADGAFAVLRAGALAESALRAALAEPEDPGEAAGGAGTLGAAPARGGPDDPDPDA